MIFERKKIQTEILGEYLKSARQNLGMSLEDVARQTNIQLKFLEALENGQFKGLPADVYIFGFLRQLADLYQTDSQELITQFKKEKGIELQIIKPIGTAGQSWQKKYFGELVVTPKILSLIGGLLFIVVTVIYIVWQVLSINKTPGLDISSPSNNSVVMGSSVDVRGHTDPSALVTVNNENVFVNDKGDFDIQVGLTPGPKTISITSSNRFGKSVSKNINVTSAALAGNNNALVLKINFSAAAILTVMVDEQQPLTLNFNSGDSKTFTGQQKIILSTSDAGATIVYLNGQNLGALGKSREPLNNIPFYAQASSTDGSGK